MDQSSQSDEEHSETASSAEESDNCVEDAAQVIRHTRRVLLALVYTFHVIIYTACLMRTKPLLQQSMSMLPEETTRLDCSSGVQDGVFYVAIYGLEDRPDKISFPTVAHAHNWFYAQENHTRVQTPLNLCVVGFDRTLAYVRECFSGGQAACLYREINNQHNVISAIINS